MDDVNIIENSDLNSNTHSISDVNIIDHLKLDAVPGLKINNINITNVLFVNKSTECVQFHIDCEFQLNLNVQLSIVYPKRIPIDKVENPLKLRINVTDSKLKKEILSCTNYLQRQRNVNLALSVLRKCAIALSERKLIFNMLLLHFEGFLSNNYQEDGGVVLAFEDQMSHFKFCETSWKILFNCKQHQVISFIDFHITTRDRVFYNTAKPLMMVLIEPNLSYEKRVELWSAVVKAANKAVQESHVLRLMRDNDVELINSPSVERYDLSDSDDDDDCIVVEDDRTEEIILN